MPPRAIGSFAAFAEALAAALGLPDDPARAARVARAAQDHALHFTHPGRARDDAVALFFQVAPAAFADPAAFAPPIDPGVTAERMVRAIRASPLGRDFRETVLAEPLFRGIAEQALRECDKP